MQSNIAVTKKMLAYAQAHGLVWQNAKGKSIASVVNPFWGAGKKTLAWRVSGSLHKTHPDCPQSAQKTARLCHYLFPVTSYPVRHDFKAYHTSGSRAASAIKLIVLHDMEVTDPKGAAESVGRYFESASSGGSTQYGVDNDSIQQYLSELVVPWGAPGANTQGIHIEQMGKSSWTAKDWNEKAAGTLARTAWLIADISKRRGIPIRTLTDAQVRAGQKGVTTHAQCTRAFGIVGGHTDPGAGYPLAAVLKKAQQLSTGGA